jgi:WD40 repeat protein
LEKADQEATSIARIDSNRIAVGHLQGWLRLYNVSTGEMEREIQLEENNSLAPISKDLTRPWLWILGGNAVRVFDLETMKTRLTYKTPDETLCLALSPVDQSAVIALRGGVFHRYRVTEESEMETMDQWVNDGQRIYNIAFDTQSDHVVTVGASGDIIAWQQRPLCRTEFTAHPTSDAIEGIYSFQIIPNLPAGQWPVLVADHAGTLMRLDTRTASRTDFDLKTKVCHKFAAIDEHRLVFTDDNSTHSVFDRRSNLISDLSIPCVAGQSLRLQGMWFADTDGSRNLIRLVDFQKPNRPIELPSQNPGCAAVALRTGQIFWNDGNAVMMRSLEPSDSSIKLETFSRNPLHLKLSADETLLAIGLSDREVHLWDWRARKAVCPVMMHQGRVLAVAFSPAGRTVLTVDDSAMLRFWNLTTGQQVSQTHLGLKPGDFINRAQFSADCKFVVILHDSKSITTVQVR